VKKILHIENSKNFTGSFKILLQTIDKADRRGNSIVALPEGSVNDQVLQQHNIPAVKFRFIELRKKAAALALYTPALFYNAVQVWKYCKKNSISIVHNNDHYNLVPVVMKMFLGSRIKLIVTVMLLPSTYNGALYKVYRYLNNKYADHIIALSNAVAAAYTTKDKSTVINGASHLPERLPPFEVREGGKFRFLHIANYIKGKGQDLAMEAFIAFSKIHPGTELHFFGNTMGLEKNEAFKRSLQEQAIAAGLGEQVYFNPFSADVEGTYKSFDVSLMFSESESFSMVCFESLYYGIPTIATDCGGPAEIIDDMESGIIVPNRNVNAMTEAMVKLYNNCDLRREFSVTGKQKVFRMVEEQPDFFTIAEAV
jgi:L-malate glycosyltransferase